jgi:hypothetical protein
LVGLLTFVREGIQRQKEMMKGKVVDYSHGKEDDA